MGDRSERRCRLGGNGKTSQMRADRRLDSRVLMPSMLQVPPAWLGPEPLALLQIALRRSPLHGIHRDPGPPRSGGLRHQEGLAKRLAKLGRIISIRSEP